MMHTPRFLDLCFGLYSPKYNFFCISCCKFYRAFHWYIVCFLILFGLGCTDQNVNEEIGGYASFFQRLYHWKALWNCNKKCKKKFSNFPKFVRFLGHFLKKQCLWKMGVVGIKQLPCPSKIASFSGNLNGEALLKVSFKNVDWFPKYKALKWKIIF